MQVNNAKWLGRGKGSGWETHLRTAAGIDRSDVRKHDVQDALLDDARRGAWIMASVRDGSYMLVRQLEKESFDIEYCSMIVHHPERAVEATDKATADKWLLAFFSGNTAWRRSYTWEPVMHLTTEAGVAVSRPHGDGVRQVLASSRLVGEWICLARSEEHFVQGESTGAGLYAIEWSREGMSAPVRSSREVAAPELADVLVDYINGRDEWYAAHEWRPIREPAGRAAGCSTALLAIVGALVGMAAGVMG